MKKSLYIFIILAILLQITSISFAEDNFQVKHSVIEVHEEECNIDISVPYFEGFENADEVNRLIRNLTVDWIGNAKAGAKELKELKDEWAEKGEELPNYFVSLIINYDYMKNGDILSLRLNTYYYAGGAHGMSFIYPITVNTRTGKIYEFKDLFKEEVNLDETITKKILNEIEKDPSGYFEDYKETILSKNGNYNYYFDGNKLVIYFDLYDIAPYAAGMPTFKIDGEEIKELLKDEVYNSIKDSKERGPISFNGVDINSNNEIVYTDSNIPLVPLRVIAESLGYKVDWNREDGAIVNGEIVKDGFLINSVTYVPIQYFTQVLKENVVFDNFNNKLMVKVYSKTGIKSNFNNLVTKFEFSNNEEDTVRMYAEAVKTRNGVIQYGLFSDELREEKYDELNSRAFDTGTSSPWIYNYEITKTGDSYYKIEFYYKTSDTSDVITKVVNLELKDYGHYWRIYSIEEHWKDM